MDEYEYVYIKQRKEFGRPCNFEDVGPKIIGEVEQDLSLADSFVAQSARSVGVTTIPRLSEHSVNTARVETQTRSMLHTEGGWPKEIDCSEAQDTLKWRKRLEKDPTFVAAVKALTKAASTCLEQNNTVDLFEHYFYGEDAEHMPEILTTRTLALFKDPSDVRRSVTKIGWHPEGPTKIVGSYASLRFQRMPDSMPTTSFIWDINERNVPLLELRTASPMTCCQYNPKNVDTLVGGCYNGLLNHYDLRKGPGPVARSAVEVSHCDPVYDVVWLQSKTGTECATVSSDGRLLFWDVRKMSEFTDECVLTDGAKDNPKSIGGVSLEWMQEAGPTKYLVGTEHGLTLFCSKKPKKAVEIGAWLGSEERGGYGRHYGPVYGVQRNPFHPKFFLTIGDWTAKIWAEDLKGPLLQTPCAPSMLSASTWSPTRAGLLFLGRQDGRLDIWDYYYRMNETILSQKVTDAALTSLNVQAQGSLAAVGDSDGVITLMQLCDGLVQPASNEKVVLGQIFDREMKREKNLEQIKKLSSTAKPAEDRNKVGPVPLSREPFKDREKSFFADVGLPNNEDWVDST